MKRPITHNVSGPEHDAILAGLRLLQNALDAGAVTPDDGDIGDILTDSQTHPGLDVEQINALCDHLQWGAY